MLRIMSLSAAVLLLVAFHPAYSEETAGSTRQGKVASESDPRQLVSMPEQARQLMRRDMLDHLSALNEIVAYLADNNLDAVAEVAEIRMGKSSMGQHRATDMGPGKFMPPAMRNLGSGMHEYASELSRLAKEGDLKGVFAALQKVTGSCVACHSSYRTR